MQQEVAHQLDSVHKDQQIHRRPYGDDKCGSVADLIFGDPRFVTVFHKQALYCALSYIVKLVQRHYGTCILRNNELESHRCSDVESNTVFRAT